jgi:splicing factor 3B subunit 3
MATTSTMFLYSLTIQNPTNIVQAVLGQFAGTKEQLIVTASGSILTLLRPDPSQGKVITLVSHNIFGIIRSIAVFRIAGSNKGECRILSRVQAPSLTRPDKPQHMSSVLNCVLTP